MNGEHVIIIIFTVIVYITMIMLSIMITWFFVDEMPKSKLPWALCNFKIEMLRVLKAFMGGTMIGYELHKDSVLICLFILLVIDLVAIYLHIFSAPYFYRSVQFTEIISISFTIVYSLYLILLEVLYILKIRLVTISLVNI